MKNVLIMGFLSAVLCSCSLLERHQSVEEASEPTAANEEKAPPLESEVARLNTKISALETKLDVLSTSMDRMQMQKSQPVIEAQPEAATTPQPNMAAPVDYASSSVAEEQPQISAAPQPARQLPSAIKNVSASSTPVISAAASTEAEKEFRGAMTLFQNGKNLESASKFAMLAKKFPQHLLASHALYWAGEAGARAQQWSLAAENWEELESRYPRSAYLPEALAGLSKAYENQGDIGKAKSYKENLLRAFPKSPVALSYSSQNSVPTSKATYSPEPQEESAPAYDSNTSQESSSEGDQE